MTQQTGIETKSTSTFTINNCEIKLLVIHRLGLAEWFLVGLVLNVILWVLVKK